MHGEVRVLKAVFLDRDGVINEDREDYVKNVNELNVYPYVPECVRILNDAGFGVFVISNQQCVSKGLMTLDDLQAIQHEIERQVAGAGGQITQFYHCIHLAQEGCSCRKPEPGLILKAAKEHDIDLAASVMVGDSERDIMAGKRAGCSTVLVTTGTVPREEVPNLPCQPSYVADDLRGAVEYILRRLVAARKG